MCAVAIQDVHTVRVLLEGGVECNEPLRHNACKCYLAMFYDVIASLSYCHTKTYPWLYGKATSGTTCEDPSAFFCAQVAVDCGLEVTRYISRRYLILIIILRSSCHNNAKVIGSDQSVQG